MPNKHNADRCDDDPWEYPGPALPGWPGCDAGG